MCLSWRFGSFLRNDSQVGAEYSGVFIFGQDYRDRSDVLEGHLSPSFLSGKLIFAVTIYLVFWSIVVLIL